MSSKIRLGALTLALMLTLAFALERRGLGAARPAAPAAAPAARAVPPPLKKTKAKRRLLASAKKTPSAPAAVPANIRGERLREKGEAFGGGKDQRRVEADEKAAERGDQ